MKAIYAGSFSPPTLGHLDIISRCAAIFDEVVVAVLYQSEKHYELGPKERALLLEKCVDGLENVRVIWDDGLLVDCARREGADVIVRGLRNTDDLGFEMQLANANRHIGGFETLYLGCSAEYAMISSTIVRDCARRGAPISFMVPDVIVDDVYAFYGCAPKDGKDV